MTEEQAAALTKEKEDKGRDQFNMFVEEYKRIEILKYSTKRFTNWDVAYKYWGDGRKINAVNVIGEIKVRKNTSTAFPDHMLELEKLEGLREHAKGKECEIHYINIYDDNHIKIWNLTNINLDNYKITKMWCQKNDRETVKVLKDVIFLNNVDLCIVSDEIDKTKSIFNGMKDNEENDELPF